MLIQELQPEANKHGGTGGGLGEVWEHFHHLAVSHFYLSCFINTRQSLKVDDDAYSVASPGLRHPQL